jgi:hypothetical protein
LLAHRIRARDVEDADAEKNRKTIARSEWESASFDKHLILLAETWLGREDSNLRMVESKSTALPLGDAPTTEERDGKRLPRPLFGHAGL